MIPFKFLETIDVPSDITCPQQIRIFKEGWNAHKNKQRYNGCRYEQYSIERNIWSIGYFSHRAKIRNENV